MFFAFDGIDGAGKSTQIERFVDFLERQGHRVLVCRDPGGTILGERIREILLAPSDVSIDMRAETLLYMASRAQLVSEVIAPALARGQAVVCDRYISANIAYQGYGGGLSASEILSIGRFATDGLIPDMTFILDLDAEVASQRLARERDRIELRGIEYFRRVRDGFLQLRDSWPGRVAIIDATLDSDQVHRQIVSAASEIRDWSSMSSERGAS